MTYAAAEQGYQNQKKIQNREWTMIVRAMPSPSVARMETVFKKDKTSAKSYITRPLNKLPLLLEKQAMLSCRVGKASQKMDTFMKIAIEVLSMFFS